MERLSVDNASNILEGFVANEESLIQHIADTMGPDAVSLAIQTIATICEIQREQDKNG